MGQPRMRSDWSLVEERNAAVVLSRTGQLVSRMGLPRCDVGLQSVEVDTAACWLEVYVRLEERNSSAALYDFMSDHATDKWRMCLP